MDGIMTDILHSIYHLASEYQMPFQSNKVLWRIIGYTGMAMFFGRFLVQWIHSEIHKESKVPLTFWWQSLIGTILMLAYSLRQHDPIYILGYVFNVVPYTRNLILIYRKKREDELQNLSAVVPAGVEAEIEERVTR